MDCIHASGTGEQEFPFPSLEIYNSSGLLIYASTNPSRNVRMLQDLPSSLHGLQPIPEGTPLARLVEAIPKFEAKEKEILQAHRPAVVSVDLAGCEGCSVQAAALASNTNRLRIQSFDVLLIHVAQP